jgi:hypothetical protein
VNTRDIRTSNVDTSCDVCGRTLLRGEKVETYLAGGSRRSVCELCKPRAVNEGWIREGTVPSYELSETTSDRRRSLLGRLRSRRERAPARDAVPTLADELDGQAWPDAESRAREPIREPRHVRAIPTSAEQKIASAVEVFNSTEHRRTVAGVARSLGEPSVSLRPADVRPSLVNVVIAWELCWYRYEVDLSEEVPGVRVVAQGYELDELEPEERQPNAVSDENGSLELA